MPADKNGQEIFPTILVILGATGDLAKKKLILALWDLYTRGHLPPLFQVVGMAKDEMDDEEFREFVREVIEKKSQGPITNDQANPNDRSSKSDEFCRRFGYVAGMFEEQDAYQKLGERLGKKDNEWRTCANKLFYIAASPVHYRNIFQNLAKSGLTEPCSPEEGWTRVIVEKPFGKDLETAQKLDHMLGQLFREEQIYRIDHYLGKDTVQNILAFRFSNSWLESAWDKKSIEHIHIQLLEDFGLEGRGGFYDGLGALRDVGQNHMLQLLALWLMENPGGFDVDSIRDARREVLGALENMDRQEIVRQTRRGQYEGYEKVEGVSKDSKTETYFWLKVHVLTDRWQGVPIYLESGKALDESKVEVRVKFRHQTPCLCPPGRHYTNVLTYRIQPQEGITTSFWVKKPGPGMALEQKDFAFDYAKEFAGEDALAAYGKLLLDVFKGDQTSFVSTAEIMASWRFVDPIIKSWQDDLVPLTMYKEGTRPAPEASAGAVPEKQIGYVGLGKMGMNMVQRLVEHGWSVAATDVDEKARQEVKKAGANAVENATAVVKTLHAQGDPNENILVWIMVPHQFVDDVLAEILPHLEEGDVIIDGGNSNYKESIERARKVTAKGVRWLDAGVSGGPAGARRGACLMIGGELKDYKELLGLWSDLAAPGGYGYMGKAGSGHFVKMVHNGIEYGMMQALGEGFAVMKAKKEFDLDLVKIANVFNHGSVIESRLVGWLKSAYAKYGQSLENISGEVAASGEGKWTVEAARELGIPVPIIEGALKFREDSQGNPSYAGQVVSALRGEFGGHEVKTQN